MLSARTSPAKAKAQAPHICPYFCTQTHATTQTMLLIVLSTLGGLARVRALILKGWPAQAGLRSVPDPDNHQSTGALSQSHF